MLCPVYGHELTPLSCPPQGVSFRSFKGLIILSPYTHRHVDKNIATLRLPSGGVLLPIRI